MSTTQLFAELLIIGIGVMAWIILLLACIPSKDLNILSSISILAGIPFLALSYVLGILQDRFSYRIFRHKKDRIKKSILGKIEEIERIKPCQLERVVTEQSANFMRKVEYNRSRLRIARSWSVNFLLIGISFIIWHANVQKISVSQAICIGVMLFSLTLISLWVSKMLQEDHYNNLRDSYYFVMSQKKRVLTREDINNITRNNVI
ncbi:MAG: hypothetical protein D3910_23725 [Candidatus Electrothrix sp. ATG2]|nr:hypothetical protein [Candidatus Electrothrix sp. ATG2]